MPVVLVGIFLHGFSFTWVDFEFVIDTGAAVTCLHPGDATRMVGIPQSALADAGQWQSITRLGGVGGGVSFYAVPVWYRFLHEDGSAQHLRGTINIAPWSQDSLSLPSLLGWDVLSEFRLTMDRSRRLIELHKSTA